MITNRNSQAAPVLLVGASGRLGSMLLRHWPAGHDLRALSRTGGERITACDPLSEPQKLAEAARGCGSVICLSGITPAHAARTGDAMTLNTDLALAALAAAEPGARVFALSSAAVYGSAAGWLREDMPVTPLSDYGRAKLEMEQRFSQAAGNRGCVLRIGNVAGADAILGNWAPGMQIDTLPDGSTPRRSYVGPVSLARIMAALTGAPKLPPLINIAAPAPVEMGALLDAAGLAWSGRPAPQTVIPQVALDTGRLQQLYRFAAEETTAAGLVAQWRQGQQDGEITT